MTIGEVRLRAAQAQAAFEAWQREIEVRNALEAASATLVWAAKDVTKKD